MAITGDGYALGAPYEYTVSRKILILAGMRHKAVPLLLQGLALVTMPEETLDGPRSHQPI